MDSYNQQLTVLVGPFDACSSTPCTNGGSCIDVNVDTFICLCRDGYFGTDCGQSKLKPALAILSALGLFFSFSLNP